ncbi:Uncharacterised protein [Salmonella enterica subsp. enterica serovar Typhi]|nr:Uncharacterised protein [Salmonella enterica subsp. enterica serovar Typhi]
MKMTELAPGILASPCVPPACCRKAVQMVRLFRQGARNYRQLNDRGSRYYKINVGRAWRRCAVVESFRQTQSGR